MSAIMYLGLSMAVNVFKHNLRELVTSYLKIVYFKHPSYLVHRTYNYYQHISVAFAPQILKKLYKWVKNMRFNSIYIMF